MTRPSQDAKGPEPGDSRSTASRVQAMPVSSRPTATGHVGDRTGPANRDEEGSSGTLGEPSSLTAATGLGWRFDRATVEELKAALARDVAGHMALERAYRGRP